jgi:hypothetical protein
MGKMNGKRNSQASRKSALVWPEDGEVPVEQVRFEGMRDEEVRGVFLDIAGLLCDTLDCRVRGVHVYRPRAATTGCGVLRAAFAERSCRFTFAPPACGPETTPNTA